MEKKITEMTDLELGQAGMQLFQQLMQTQDLILQVRNEQAKRIPANVIEAK